MGDSGDDEKWQSCFQCHHAAKHGLGKPGQTQQAERPLPVAYQFLSGRGQEGSLLPGDPPWSRNELGARLSTSITNALVRWS